MALPTKKIDAADREAFFRTLALYDRPEAELRQRVLDADVDIDAFVDRAFGGATIPPL